MVRATLRPRQAIILLLTLVLFVTAIPAQAQEPPRAFEPLFPWDSSQRLIFTGGPHDWAVANVRSGLDFSSGLTTTPVLAVADGEVFFVDEESCTEGDCRAVKIEHDGGWETWYVHLNEFSPRLQNFRAGTRLAIRQGDWVGNEGRHGAGSVHIHLELYQNDRPVSWSAMSIDGWQAHDTCDGYNKEANTAQNRASCSSNDYGYYVSNGTTQVLPATRSDGYPQVSFNSTNRMRGDAYLTQLPNTIVVTTGLKPEISFALQNVGPYDWARDSERKLALMRVSGTAPIAVDELPLPQDVRKGRELSWNVRFTEPLSPGIYQSTWRMATNREPFGDPVVLVLHVLPEGSSASLVDELQTLYDNGRAELERLYRESAEQFNAELERLKREAERRAQEEAQRRIEEMLCGAVPATVLLALLSISGIIRRRWRQ